MSWFHVVVARDARIRRCCCHGNSCIGFVQVRNYNFLPQMVGINDDFHCPSGPRIEDGKCWTWWVIDFGKNQLIVNFYSIRHDGSENYLRNWLLQGYSGGNAWVTLKQHTDDMSLQCRGQWASWAVLPQHPFSAFRLLLSGVDDGGQNHFHMSNIEFYGRYIEQ